MVFHLCKAYCDLVPVTRTYMAKRIEGDKVYAATSSKQRKFKQNYDNYQNKEEKRSPSVQSTEFKTAKQSLKKEPPPIASTPSTSMGDATQKHPHFKIPKLKIDSFSGDALAWPRFITDFNDIVLNYANEPKTRLKYLISNCEGRAKQAIINKTMINDPVKGYEDAISVLEKRFGSEKLILTAVRKELHKGTHLSGTFESLHDYAIRLEHLSGILHWLDKSHELDTYDTTQIIFKKLPYRLQELYLWQEQTSGDEMLFDNLLEFIHNAAEVASTPHGRDVVIKTGRDERKQMPISGAAFLTNENNNQSTGTYQNNAYKCSYCKENGHGIYRCPRFQNSTLSQRRDFVREQHRCYGCLKKNHFINGVKKSASVSECPSKGKCGICHVKGHHTLLHPPSNERIENQANAVNVVNNTFNTACNSEGPDYFVRLPVIPVRVSIPGKRFQSEFEVLCFLDQGSSVNFISNK